MRHVLWASFLLSCLSGCVTLGPKVETKTVFVETVSAEGNALVVGRVGENRKVRVFYKRDDGSEYSEIIDIGGWGLVHPNAMRTINPPPEPGKTGF
jgi:hypothetical protein